jgi:hypothetical protein
VALFNHYDYPQVETSGAVLGLVTFHPWENLGDHFILVDKKRWEEWCHTWCYVRFSEPDKSFAKPPPPPRSIRGDSTTTRTWSIIDRTWILFEKSISECHFHDGFAFSHQILRFGPLGPVKS